MFVSFLIAKEKIEFWVPASDANTFALFNYTIELRRKIYSDLELLLNPSRLRMHKKITL